MILGIDAATTKLGYSIINYEKEIIDYGVFRTLSSEPMERIKEVYLFINDLINNNKIDVLVIEDVPVSQSNNLKTAADLCRLQGVIFSLCIKNNIPMVKYNPTSWRSIMGLYNGNRESTKREYQKNAAINKVNDLYGLNFVYFERETKINKTDDDKAEAILIALSYLEKKEEDLNE